MKLALQGFCTADANRYSSVSSAVMRVKTKLQKDKKLKGRLELIENNILKGQTKT